MCLFTAVLASLGVIAQLSAQENTTTRHGYQQYRLYDMGAFGGPTSWPSTEAISLTRAGAVGTADTSVGDPFSPNCFLPDCLIAHAFQWRYGVLTDLGSLPGKNGENSSYAFAINNGGLVVGVSENGSIDPATGYPEVAAVAWDDGKLLRLSTLGGTQSQALMLNDRGQIIGSASNTVSDPFSFGGFFPASTEVHAALWQHGSAIRDLGTLGGPDSIAYIINRSGQVTGWSYTSYTPNLDTGIPTIDAFVWDRGRMIDLGTLGGTLGYSTWINNRSQVVGYSNLAGDQNHHPFLWDRGVLTDLRTLGGSQGAARCSNENGVGTGNSRIADDSAVHATLWKNRQVIDLGTLKGYPCSRGYSINTSEQVVGYSATCDSSDSRAFLSEKGGPAVDLNALIEPPSDIVLTFAWVIDDRGEILAQGVLPNGDLHSVLLVPDGECGITCEQRIAESTYDPSRVPTTTTTRLPLFGKSADRFRYPLVKGLD